MTTNNNRVIECIHTLDEEIQLNNIYLNNQNVREKAKQELISILASLKTIKDRGTKAYKGSIPYKGDARYSKFPNKELLDDLRIAFYNEYEPRDLSITYRGVQEAFDNDFHLYTETYFVRGRFPYTIMFEQSYNFSEPNPKPTLIVSLPITELFTEEATIAIDILVNYLESHTGSPINFIYTDRLLSEVSFARIGTSAFKQNKEGIKDYYSFFYNFYDAYDNSYLKNVVYIGEDIKKEVPDSVIRQVEQKFLLPYGVLLAKENGIMPETIGLFNETVKEKILKI